jgi:predicted exporter
LLLQARVVNIHKIVFGDLNGLTITFSIPLIGCELKTKYNVHLLVLHFEELDHQVHYAKDFEF